ncbi:MAG: TRAP transporter small permease [Pseudomonadota bacterium]
MTTRRPALMFKRAEFLLDTLGAIAVALLCLLIVVTVFSREAFAYAIPDSIILVRELMVPAILFPLSATTSRRAHVAIDLFANHFPDALNRWIAAVAALIGIVIVAALVVAGWQQFVNNWNNGAHHGGDFLIPKWISRAAYFVAFGFVLMRMIQMFFLDLRAALTGQPAPAEL